MNAALRRSAWPLLALGVALAATLLGVTTYGLWDPLELDLLDGARPSDSTAGPPLAPWAIRLFDALAGDAPAAARIPIALFGLLALVVTHALARLATDGRGASYAALLLAGTPLFVLNARLVLGESTALLAQALVALGGFALLVVERRAIPLAASALALGLVLAALGSGLLLGALPALGAAAACAWLAPPVTAPRAVRASLTLTAFAIGASVAFDVWRDAATYRLTLGGSPRGDEPPAFHHALEVAFHGLGPLAALAPLGARWFFLEERDDRAAGLARFALLWLAFAYGAVVLFEARYGVTTFAAAPALAVLVALVLRERDDRLEGSRLSALVVALLGGLWLRDAVLFPSSVFDSLPVRGLAVPEDVDLRPALAAGALLFLVVTISVLGARLEGPPPSFAAPYRALRARLERSRAARIQLALSALAVAIFGALGLVGAIAPGLLPLRSVVARTLGVIALVALALPAIVASVQGTLLLVRRLGAARHGAIALAAASFGLVFAFGSLGTLSRAFSPRDAFETLASHRGEGEPLYVYETAERSLHRYAAEPFSLADSAAQLSRALSAEERVWLVLPKSKLSEANRLFRSKHGAHLFVVDTENPLAYVATTRPLEGLSNLNPIARFVSSEPPQLAHEVGAKLKGGYELVSYEIDGDPSAVQAGERFTLRLLWHAERRGTRTYQVFVHMDGPSGRVHGDHDPADGLHPTSAWQAGDYVLDEVEMRVPAHFAPGSYTLYVGLYQGSHRAKIVSGEDDSNDRIVAGAVQVR